MSKIRLTIKSGEKGTAKEHAKDIMRRDGQEQKGYLVAIGHGNLPVWANNDPEIFWQASDEHERKNGAAYREVKITIPGDLELQEHSELVQHLTKEMIGSKPYQYAVNSSNDSSDANETSTHIRLMFSDRADDGIARSAELTFKRFNPRNPERGGRRKDSGSKNRPALRDEYVEARRLCVELQKAAK